MPRVTETAAKARGLRTGAFFAAEGQDYGKVRGHYPSNPYPNGSQQANDYDEGYEEGFNNERT